MFKVLKAAFIGLVAFSLLGIASVSLGETIVVKGSTTVLPVAMVTAEAYMAKTPGLNISISGGGSGNGMKALLDKSTDIANASRFIKDKEVKMALEKGIYPVPHRVAIDAIVPVVHPSNPVKDLTIEHLSLIYQGKIKNWKIVGGNDMQIVVVSRDTSSGTYEVWAEKVLHDAKVMPQAQLQASNGAVAQAIAKNKYAIGYVGLGYLNKDLKALKVGGVSASAETALSGKYPIARALFMFTDGWPTGDVSGFLNFILSREGQELVKKEGFVPLY